MMVFVNGESVVKGSFGVRVVGSKDGEVGRGCLRGLIGEEMRMCSRTIVLAGYGVGFQWALKFFDLQIYGCLGWVLRALDCFLVVCVRFMELGAHRGWSQGSCWGLTQAGMLQIVWLGYNAGSVVLNSVGFRL